MSMQKNWRDLIRPKNMVVDRDTLSATYGKFVAEPLERGYGVTLGNSLRRILLSSLQGASFTSVRIDGASHEFMSVPDVKEDVTDIILNLKEVDMKLHGAADGKTVRLEIQGPKEVKASDITHDESVVILNPDQHICTVAEGGTFKADLTIKRGRGYVAADKNFDEDLGIGWIPVDSIHSPVKKVNYLIEAARVGQNTGITGVDRRNRPIPGGQHRHIQRRRPIKPVHHIRRCRTFGQSRGFRRNTRAGHNLRWAGSGRIQRVDLRHHRRRLIHRRQLHALHLLQH